MTATNPLKPEIAQLHRAMGQLRAVEKMMYKKTSLSELIQQLEAARGNIKSIEKLLLTAQCKDIRDPELKRAILRLSKIV